MEAPTSGPSARARQHVLSMPEHRAKEEVTERARPLGWSSRPTSGWSRSPTSLKKPRAARADAAPDLCWVGGARHRPRVLKMALSVAVHNHYRRLAVAKEREAKHKPKEIEQLLPDDHLEKPLSLHNLRLNYQARKKKKCQVKNH